MAKKRPDLKIPYGIMDFRRLRREGYYYVDKTEYLYNRDGPYRLPQGCHTNGLKRIRSDYLPIIGRLWRKEPALHVPS